MKKVFLIPLAIMIAGGLILGGSSHANAKKTMVLQYEFWLPSKVPEYQYMLDYYKGLEEATGGAVKVQFNPGGAMGKVGETYQRTLQGVNNIGHFNPAFNYGVFPMWDLFNYPVHCASGEQLARFQIAMYEKGYFDKEFSQVKITALYNVGSYILFSNKPVTTVADFKGLKIRVPSEGWVDICKAIGAVPVTLPTGEMYISLQKGIADAVANIWDAAHVFKLNEVSKYVTELYVTTSTHIEAWNVKTWEALPQAGKDYINKTWKEYSVKCAKKYDDLIPKFQKEFLNTGPDREIVEFAPGELDKLDKLIAPVWEKWVADYEAKGLPASKALKELYKMMTDGGVDRPLAGYVP